MVLHKVGQDWSHLAAAAAANIVQCKAPIWTLLHIHWASLVAQTVKRLPAMRETWVRSGRLGFNPGIRKIPWRRKWQFTPALLPGKSRKRRSLIGYRPWVPKKSDTTQWTSLSLFIFMVLHVFTLIIFLWTFFLYKPENCILKCIRSGKA